MSRKVKNLQKKLKSCKKFWKLSKVHTCLNQKFFEKMINNKEKFYAMSFETIY